MMLENYVSRVDDYLKSCSVNDAIQSREALITKSVDDDMRALWMAGVNITLVFLRLAIGDIFEKFHEGKSWSDLSLFKDKKAAEKLFDEIRQNAQYWDDEKVLDNDMAFNSLSMPMLVSYLKNFTDERMNLVLGNLLNVENPGAFITMLDNIAHLEKLCSLCVPYYRMRGFSRLGLKEMHDFYRVELPVDPDTELTADTVWVAHAALISIIGFFPFGEDWLDKANRLEEVLKDLSDRHSHA